MSEIFTREAQITGTNCQKALAACLKNNVATIQWRGYNQPKAGVKHG
jgi:hypothetical protein